MSDEKKDEKKLERLYATRDQGGKAAVIGLLLAFLGFFLLDTTAIAFGVSFLAFGLLAGFGSSIRIHLQEDE